MTFASKCCTGKTVELSAGKVTQRMTGKQIQRQQDDIHQQDNRTHAYPEAVVKKEAADRIMPEKRDEYHRQIKKIAVQVLQDERELGLAEILAPRFFGNRATRRIKKEIAVVVARGPEPQRPTQNQQCRRQFPPVVMGINQRRVERREIRAPLVIRALE